MARLAFRMPEIRSAAGALAIVLIAVSVLGALFKPFLVLTALVPEAVIHGFVWQLLTYAFVENSPTGVIFGALITWSIGGALEMMWGRRRMLFFTAGVVVLAAIFTVALALLVPALVREWYPGGTVMTGALWVAYGLQIGRGPANFWGLPTTGNVLALIGVGFVFLNGAFAGISTVIPSAFALLFTFLYTRGFRPSELWTRFQTWRLQRSLDKRSAHLRTIDGGRSNMGRDSDKYLH
ncbi:MAG: rhomboid family intramembrane serine protease [Archangium sp.]